MQHSDSNLLRSIVNQAQDESKNDRELLKNSPVDSLMEELNLSDHKFNADDVEEEFGFDFIEEDEEINSTEGQYLAFDIDEDEEPIVIEGISDELGRYSDRVTSICDQLHTTIIPLDMAGILPEVVSLKEHEIVNIAGIDYAYSDSVRTEIVDALIAKAVDEIRKGSYFKYSLNVSIEYNGTTYDSLFISPKEAGVIMSKLRRYKARLFAKQTGEVFLLVGGAE